MKQVIALFLLAMGLLTACSNDDDNNNVDPKEQEELRPNPSPYDVKIDGICYQLVHKSGIAIVLATYLHGDLRALYKSSLH